MKVYDMNLVGHTEDEMMEHIFRCHEVLRALERALESLINASEEAGKLLEVDTHGLRKGEGRCGRPTL